MIVIFLLGIVLASEGASLANGGDITYPTKREFFIGIAVAIIGILIALVSILVGRFQAGLL